MSAIRATFGRGRLDPRAEKIFAREGKAYGPTKKPEGVRIATPDDEEQIFALLMLMAEEIALLPVSEGKVRNIVQSAISRKTGGAIGVIEEHGKIVGAVCLSMNQPWYSEGWFCDELWNFVHPDHRRSDYAVRLITFSKWWAEQIGMPLAMGIMSTKRTLGKLRLYASQLRLIGGIFLWGPNGQT